MMREIDWTFYGWAVIGLVWIGRAVRALITLKHTPQIPLTEAEAATPRVSIIIPVRNEEANIGDCLDSLLAQRYPDFEILVANNDSTDRTPEILRRYGNKIRVVDTGPTPEGWTGKNFAIHTAISHARGGWFLFTDADTRHAPQGLASAMNHAAARGLKLLTLLPRCLTNSAAEDLIQPCAMAHLGLWFPMEKVNNPKAEAYFGNGQYLLFERKTYEVTGGHTAVRAEFLEDFHLAKRVKGLGQPMQLARGMNVFGTRMYPSLAAMWRGWRRIYLHAFEKKTAVLAWKFLDVLVFTTLPFFFYIPFAAKFLPTAVVLFILATTWTGYGIVKAKRIYALGMPFAGLFVAGTLLDAAFTAATGKKTKWRD